MKIKLLIKTLILSILLIPNLLVADEGMWLLNLIEELNYTCLLYTSRCV